MTNTIIPSYEEALQIVEKSEAFYVSRGEVEGYEYAMFNYRMALYEDFADNDAFELRGMTYINVDGDWDTYSYPMLNKFFNLNENVSTQYGLVKDKEIESVEYKEDGSLITLIVLPNGKVVPKTKMSFDNDQTDMVKKWLLDNPQVVETAKNRPLLTFLFELVSPKNKIVLKYNKTELRLLQIRGTITGDYKDDLLEHYAKVMDVPMAKTYNHTLDELLEMRETLEEIEGWVKENIGDKKFSTTDEFFEWIHKGRINEKISVSKRGHDVKGNIMIMSKLDYLILAREYILEEEGYVIKFSDGQMIKMKHLAYVAAHGLMDDLSKEHKIIEMILNETIDDVLSELEEGSEEKVEIEEIMVLIDHYFNHRVQKAEDLKETFLGEYKSNRKNFAIRHNKTEDFGIVMRNLSDDADIAKAVKARMLQELSHLEKAREFLDELRKEQEMEDYIVDIVCSS